MLWNPCYDSECEGPIAAGKCCNRPDLQALILHSQPWTPNLMEGSHASWGAQAGPQKRQKQRLGSIRTDSERGRAAEGGRGRNHDSYKTKPTVPSSVGNKNHSSAERIPSLYAPCSRYPFRLGHCSTRKKKEKKNLMWRKRWEAREFWALTSFAN